LNSATSKCVSEGLRFLRVGSDLKNPSLTQRVMICTNAKRQTTDRAIHQRTADMNFEELIETLSKGSATAVTTLESNVAELNALKEYLYVQTPVEQALRSEIDRNLKSPRVIFVCGSSGDGKSELFRRIHASYAKKVRFHLDATHSFDPQKDAIQTLDDQFAAFKAGNQSRGRNQHRHARQLCC
jgi:ABC-type uncharacterized transport system fused permease/ATPase subunit